MRRLFFALSLVAACGHNRVSLEPPGQPISHKEYVDELKRWSRHGQIFFDFDAALQVDATFKSVEFRQAYASQWIELYHVSPTRAGEARQQILDDGGQSYEFFLSTAAHYQELNDFSRRSVWRVALVNDDGNEVLPVTVDALRDKRDMYAAFFPYISVFARTWRVRFPRALPDGKPLISSGTKVVTLRLSGPPGSVDLAWKLR